MFTSSPIISQPCRAQLKPSAGFYACEALLNVDRDEGADILPFPITVAVFR
jgi:hypothetical protein